MINCYITVHKAFWGGAIAEATLIYPRWGYRWYKKTFKNERTTERMPFRLNSLINTLLGQFSVIWKSWMGEEGCIRWGLYPKYFPLGRQIGLKAG